MATTKFTLVTDWKDNTERSLFKLTYSGGSSIYERTFAISTLHKYDDDVSLATGQLLSDFTFNNGAPWKLLGTYKPAIQNDVVSGSVASTTEFQFNIRHNGIPTFFRADVKFEMYAVTSAGTRSLLTTHTKAGITGSLTKYFAWVIPNEYYFNNESIEVDMYGIAIGGGPQ